MEIRVLKNFINGEWQTSSSTRFLDNINPSTGKVISKVLLSTKNETKNAISAAAKAFPMWSATAVSTRTNYFFKLRELIKKNERRIAEIICEENGKSLPDSLAEMKRMRQNIEVACGMPALLKGAKLPQVADGIDTESIKLPIGVFAMIAPFNFPAMVPFWFLPYAVASGNTYILKPSEQVPDTQNFIFELIEKCNFPPGVISMINGDAEVATELLDNPLVKGVSFVGSTRNAHLVLEKCAVHAKRCQSMGGAKNYLVVMPDADLEKAVENMLTSCFGCSGQRCMAASVIACIGSEIYEKTKKTFIAAVDKMIIANPLDPKYKNEKVLMGPVISEKARDRILDFIEIAKEEGFKIILDKSRIKVKSGENGFFLGPTIIADVTAGSKTERTEIFGPVVSMMKVDSLDEVLQILEDSPYGNGASIYTRDGKIARKFELEAKCGMIGINLGVPAPVAYFPFGGMKESQLTDIKAQASRVVNFFTEEKIITRRFF